MVYLTINPLKNTGSVHFGATMNKEGFLEQPSRLLCGELVGMEKSRSRENTVFLPWSREKVMAGRARLLVGEMESWSDLPCALRWSQ